MSLSCKIYVYPPLVPESRNIINNPYIKNLIDGISEFCDVLNTKTGVSYSIIDLFIKSFVANVIIFNWPENIGNRKFGTIQFGLFLIIINILTTCKVKIVWIMHNMHPHSGETNISKYIKQLMMKKSAVIFTHSTEACSWLKSQTDTKSIFINHPVTIRYKCSKETTIPEYDQDILIWGSIEPYKGIPEFLETYKQKNNFKWKIKIIGRCKDYSYCAKLDQYLSKDIVFENREVEFNELNSLISKSRFVLFPYLSSSTSSSGVLMDTLGFLGNVIGPNKAAFKDLNNEHVCFVYNNFDELSEIITKNERISDQTLRSFIEVNSWKAFSSKLSEIILSL